MTKHYKVGYGKPPKAHQWKPRQSGNPSGKKRKANKASDAKVLADYIVEELLEHVSPKLGGKKQKMLAAKALAKVLVRDAMTGTPREKTLVLKEFRELGVFQRLERVILGSELNDKSDSPISVEERLMLEALNEALDLDDGDS